MGLAYISWCQRGTYCRAVGVRVVTSWRAMMIVIDDVMLGVNDVHRWTDCIEYVLMIYANNVYDLCMCVYELAYACCYALCLMPVQHVVEASTAPEKFHSPIASDAMVVHSGIQSIFL